MDRALVDGESQDARHLVGLLAQLVREHGQKGAAVELGVGERTLRRSLAQREISPRLRMALERYAMLRAGAEVPESPLVRRLDALEARMDGEEEARRALVSMVEELRADLVQRRSEVDRSIEEQERRVTDLGHEVKAFYNQMQTQVQEHVEMHHLPAADTPLSSANGDGGSASLKAPNSSDGQPESESAVLLREWDAAHAREAGARTGLDRARAAERRLEVELRLIREYGEPVLPGNPSWAPAVRSRELAWRGAALEDRRRARRRYEHRRLLRRVLTLGLWWR